MSEQVNPSMTTIFTLVNSMIGGAMLTFPILFRDGGIATGILVLIVSAIVSYKTCRIYVIHLAPADKDVEDSIRRIMGGKWEGRFRLITGFYLVLLNIIYIVLIVDQAYNIVYFVMAQLGAEDKVAEKNVDHLVFDKFSKQYLSVLMFAPLLAMTFITNLTFVIKLASYGVISIMVYFCFILYEFWDSLSLGVDWDQISWISTDIGGLAGTSALAFTIHTVVATVIKANQHQNNNLRDLRISYAIGLLLYVFIGALGCFAIQGRVCKETIVNCYLKDKASVVVEVTYFLMLMTVFPCFIEVGRSRLLLYFFPKISKTHFRYFNLLFMIVSTLFCFLGPYIGLDVVMSLVGSVVCYFFVYLIPSLMHMQCLYKNSERQDPSLLASETTEENLNSDNNCSHSSDEHSKQPIALRRVGYGFLNFIGIFIGVYGIYQVIEGIVNPDDADSLYLFGV